MSEKDQGWEEVKFDKEEPRPVTVKMLTTRNREGELFGAGRVYVNLFGTEVRCVALLAGDEKYVVQPQHGPDWLVQRGLDRETAEQLVVTLPAHLQQAEPVAEGVRQIGQTAPLLRLHLAVERRASR